MSKPTDEPDVTILPEPDLNPLMNPLLAKHMGRWAEVYFTTPPEKRAEAVSELVRELTRNSPTVDITATPSRTNNDDRIDEAPEDFSDQLVIGKPFAQQTATLVCGSCGSENSAVQKFCGMCGAPLAFSEESDSQEIAEEAPVSARVWDAAEGSVLNRAGTAATDSTPGFYAHDEDFAVSENLPVPSTGWRPTEFHSLTQYEPEPTRRNYRIYVGLAVVAVLASLVYITWRSNTTFWRSGTPPAALPQAVPAPSGEPQAAPAKPVQAATTQSNSANNEAPTRPLPAPLPPSQKQPSRSAENDRGLRSRSGSAIVPAAATPSAIAPEQSGSEELATAEKYLNAGPGVARNSQQAVPWLWKAVAKQNLTATMLLSDLYLRGDGVTKSCDQAHLLLDVAARKGRPAAAERLRNMQAFGCP